MNDLHAAFAAPAREALPRLTPDERRIVEAELREMERRGPGSGRILDGLREVAARIPERLYADSAEVLLRMHEIAGSGNLQSNLSSLALVRACFAHGLVDDGGTGADGTGEGPAELVVGRGHIAPAFYAEHYVRGTLPFAPWPPSTRAASPASSTATSASAPPCATASASVWRKPSASPGN